MKNKLKSNINEHQLELLSLILIIIWCVIPIIIYVFKNTSLNTILLSKIFISLIGIYGYFVFIITKKWKYINEKTNIRQIIKNNIPILLILLLILLSIISTMFAYDKNLAIFGEIYRNEGLIMYLFYIGIILLISTIKNKKYIMFIFNTIIFSSLVIVLLPLLKNNYKTEIFSWGYKNIFHHSNHYGYYLLISSSLAMFNFIYENKLIKQLIYLIISIILIYFLIINDTFGCYLACITTLLVALIYSLITKWKTKKILIILLIFIILSVLGKDINGNNISKTNILNLVKEIETLVKYEKQENTPNISNQEKTIVKEIKEEEINNIGTNRMNLWKEGIKVIKKHPIVGIGIENMNRYYQMVGIQQDRPHNIIIQIALFIGLPGTIIYIILIGYIFIKNLTIQRQEKNKIVLVALFTSISYFISSMFGNSMYYTSPYYMILLGVLIYSVNNKYEKENMYLDKK